MIKTLRAAGAILTVCLFVAGCVSTGGGRGHPGEHGRLGMDRVSPVRSADLNTRLGVGYFERGDLKIAIEKLERAISLDPAHVPAYITLALVQERLGRDAVARRHYRKAANLAPDDGATLNTYAVFLCQQGEYREADELFRRAVRDPFYETREVVLTNAGSCARRDGRWEEAQDYLRAALDYNSEYPAALYQMTRLYLLQDEAFRARAFLQRYEAVAQADPSAMLLGMQIEQKLGNRQQADHYFSLLEKEFPDSEEAKRARQRSENYD
ncbi:MAG TPA: type IV pilus biogenesis/stability protein PilW [Wenzhouxiangella sp.]|nr:type IV pilus biogenesis/stability protein PilW [Wenzhouxiangella sp.]